MSRGVRDAIVDQLRACKTPEEILNFENVRILRLPIVFGKGFKKNYLYDMINKNNLERICPDSLVQFYDVSDLHKDINASWNSIPIIRNLATEPLLVRDIAKKHFPKPFIHAQSKKHFPENVFQTGWSENVFYLFIFPEI